MIVAVYKERGLTSRAVVNEIKNKVREKKVGHGGTLDHLASGVLVVGVSREGTKKLHTERFNEKEYIGKIKLGEKSTTDDREGEKEKKKASTSDVPKVGEIEIILRRFVGDVMQIPPAYSAVKVSGKESYKLARKGFLVKHKERPVKIEKIEILSYRYPLLTIRVVTGPGVYIRSLARDIGDCLVGGGYLYSLLRTRVGGFTLENCVKIEEIPGLRDNWSRS